MKQIIPFSLDGSRVLRLPVAIVNWPLFSYRPHVTAGLRHDGRSLFVRFDVEEAHLRALETEDNHPVCTDSCVEAFILGADGVNYFNFECNPLGTLLAAHRPTRADKTVLTQTELSSVLRVGSYVAGVRAPFELRPEPGETCRWWIELGIPFRLLGFADVPDSLRLNLYKCGDRTDCRHYLSLFPIATETPDFHRPEFFGEFMIETN